ncbi:hypothetical protein PP641_gp060 [Arthrobacter phage SilentRX]|uniref:Uncharacterized protein n=1 Tax=Arthrobacter phage SilentRX TaxID=2836091 RepID=A0A8F3E9W2_9CAUD|nr:hypothetical protein PP641_gp060 [Arthrobacter phage SilentRX]QWY82800.1 hypothetical protein SEA_SILENTRX_60 [Arthrobacter phage SilentRX]
MALTRRFFTTLAREFLLARPDATEESIEMAVWERMVRITAHNLAAQNAMFNFAKFYEACGMPEEVVAVARG